MGFASRYRLEERIGRGGMAEVFRARRLGPDGFEKIVCIKRILAEQSRSIGFEAMFRDEARLAALLCHASIVQVFDFDRDDEGRLFIAMEYVHGVSLRRLAVATSEKGSRIDPATACAVARGALMALHHASTHMYDGRPLGVIHRDISPHNILLSTSGEVKLADFGIAKAFISAVHTRTGVVKGKASYMSPEQAAGRKLDIRSDLYSLGVVMWELIAGRRLFVPQEGVPWLAMLAAPRHAPPIMDHAPDTPPDLARLVDALLRVDRDTRPATPAAALELFEKVQAASPIAIGALVESCMPAESPVEALAPTVPRDDTSDTVRDQERTVDVSPPHPMDSADIITSTRNAGPPATEDPTPRPVTAERTPPPRNRLASPVAIALASCVGALVAVALVTALLAHHRSGSRPAETPAAPTQVTSPAAPPSASEPSGPPPVTGVLPANASDSPPVEPATEAMAHSGATVPPAHVVPAGWGSINVNAKPWAHVYVDGKSVGDTPLRLGRLRAGTHTVKLVNADLGLSTKLLVKVTAGQSEAVSYDFTSP